MPRKYQRKTSRGSWSSESMVLAVRKVLNNEMGYLKASKTYGVPQSTLEDRVRKIRKGEVSPIIGSQKKGLGRLHPVFSKTQEEELVKYILVLEERLLGLTLTDVRRLAFELAERNGIPHSFNHAKKQAGKDWLYGFLERNPSLSLRSPEQTSLARAKRFNQDASNQFYELLESLIEEHHFPPQNINNVVETTDHPLNIDQQLDHQPSMSASRKTGANPSTLQDHRDQSSITPRFPTPGLSTGDAGRSAQRARTQSLKPGPSSHSSFLVSPREIQPISKEKEKRKKIINRNRGATDIVGSSLYKANLVERLSKTEKPPTAGRKHRQKSGEKKGIRNSKGVDAEEAQKRGKKRKISSPEREEKVKEVSVSSGEDDDDDTCINCNALLSDNMIHGSLCQELAQDTCSRKNPAQEKHFVCDFCKALVPEITIL